MLLNKEELKVLDAFRRNLNKSLSISDVQKASGKASKTYVFNTLKKLGAHGFVEKTFVGTSGAYKAKFGLGTIKYFSLLDLEDFERSKVPQKTVEKLLKELKPLKAPFCLVIFGSYAKGKATERSDIDIAIIVSSNKERKLFAPLAESVSLREIIPIHCEIITTNEFFKMLLAKEANLGKEIAYNHIIVFGNEGYYQIIEEAYSHGYSG